MIQRDATRFEAAVGVAAARVVCRPAGRASVRIGRAGAGDDALGLARFRDVAAAISWLNWGKVEPALSGPVSVLAGRNQRSRNHGAARGAPLARLCVVAGSWCEGETRSGRPWPGVWRVYAISGRSARRELAALAAGRPTVWNLPPRPRPKSNCWPRWHCGTPHRRCEQHRQVAGHGGGVGRVGRGRFVLADACRSLGYEAGVWRTLPERFASRPTVVLWDTSAAEAACGAARRADFGDCRRHADRGPARFSAT